MPVSPSASANNDYSANLRKLVGGRWLVLAVLAVLTLGVPSTLAIPLPQLPLLASLGIAALFNGYIHWQTQRNSQASAHELFSHLLFDIGILSAFVFFSGGAANPLVSLLLPPVAIAALTLPGRLVALLCATAIGAYSLLMLYYVPLPISDASRATRLHLIGMWLIFVVSAVMVGWLIVRMTRQIRQRDHELAAAREQALRDERIMAMGTLAAGAAHELGTPLGTITLLAGELAAEPGLSAAAQADLALLRQQLGQCKAIITGLSRRAGAERLESADCQPADHWLEQVRQHWHAARPQAASRLIIATAGPAPQIIADPRLEQAVLNLLNNACNASQQTLEIRLDWQATQLAIAIRDHGPGFPPSVLALGGQSEFPAHAQGSGVGLLLTRSAIEQLGGRLSLSNPADGGALARIELPLPTPCTR